MYVWVMYFIKQWIVVKLALMPACLDCTAYQEGSLNGFVWCLVDLLVTLHEGGSKYSLP